MSEMPQPAMAEEPLRRIKAWQADERPREKLMARGSEALSNAELLAILIGSGTPKVSAVDLMRRVMADCHDSLRTLAGRSLEELMAYKGIGEAKAITLMAASELGRRRQKEAARERLNLNSAESIWQYLRPQMQDLTTEEAWLLLLDRRFGLIGDAVRLSQGGMTETAIDARVVVRHALLGNATVVVLAHNHPSGNPNPSREDDRITHSIKQALDIMRIHLADHIIVTDGHYYSYAEEGKL